MRIVYDREPCTRCGGCGEYSWCQMHGTKCFKCGGSGQQLTKHAKSAKAAVESFFAERFTRDARDLTPGVQIRDNGRWYRLTSITPEGSDCNAGLDQETGYWVPCMTLHCAAKPHGIGFIVPPDARRVVRPSVDEFNATVIPFARTLRGVKIEETAAA